MKQHTLLVHVGIPKTGTSALQEFLYRNNEPLKEYGWSYPDLKNVIGKADSYFLEFMNATVLYKAENILDTHSENWIHSWDFLRKELTRYNVILSSEMMFTWGKIESFLEEVKREYQNIKVVIYLRRQDLFLESYWAQVVKADNYVKSFEESRQEFEQYTHYLDLLYS
ncbi:MAG: hypothetical protein K2N34_15315, partial [Lachnospiraceae bacterium]|nr:hypothetical protein [Lachnospiraceae bacterium]